MLAVSSGSHCVTPSSGRPVRRRPRPEWSTLLPAGGWRTGRPEAGVTCRTRTQWPVVLERASARTACFSHRPSIGCPRRLW